ALIPTYHPNFLLKNPSLKKEVFLDLQKVQKLLV
ncbi:MAG TPA: uracil-DNA glycosylase, partial [Campylobacterales bacterium]|nr:uracil-DNA glycosylase [Campylobacterales bacterium]